MTGYHRVVLGAVAALWGLGLGGCASWQTETAKPCTEQQEQILRLQELLVEKDSEIARLQAHQQARVRELEETTVQAARAEVKLRRFVTETDVASRLAEVEVALGALQARAGGHGGPLQALAQQLLDKASRAFQQGEHSAAADLSAQSRQLIDMLLANEAVAKLEAAPEASFMVAIPLNIKVDTRLRDQPGTRATILEILSAATPVMALGFHGLWLQVQTPERNTGWVSSELVELP
jgi:ribosomal protein S25